MSEDKRNVRMLNPDLIKNAIDLATREVFGTMLDIPLADENLGGQSAEGGVVALVGLTGNWSGTGTISCSPATASGATACRASSTSTPRGSWRCIRLWCAARRP